MHLDYYSRENKIKRFDAFPAGDLEQLPSTRCKGQPQPKTLPLSCSTIFGPNFFPDDGQQR
jgi:hypothetical protein